MSKKINKVAMLGVAALISVMAQPAAAQWYGGVSAGVTSTKINESYVAVTGSTANSYTAKERDTGFKLQVGYQANQNFSLEGGYVDLGKFKLINNVTAPFVGSATGTGTADGWNMMAVGMLPVSKDFSFIGKLGTLYSTTKVDITTSGAVTLAAGALASRKQSEWNLAYGLGFQYALDKSVSLRGEWERFDGLGREDTLTGTGKYDFNLYSVGVNFKF